MSKTAFSIIEADKEIKRLISNREVTTAAAILAALPDSPVKATVIEEALNNAYLQGHMDGYAKRWNEKK